ncbi:restriction endonuclease subunit S [Phaeodactylibacter xiamenensis]|uniref:restriction endonuclease subunit S n=1 Tax=Phaeodactylibacter xiamenensis TaxID=1524460 RepID=UPI0024A7D77C|nr:restriction endonuclease subunit S [Phaeodactylibacter xiamenensis]
MKWERVELGEIAEINPRKDLTGLTDETSVAFIGMANVSEITNTLEKVNYRQVKEVKKGYTFIPKGSILLAKITPCFENGKVALAKIESDVGFGSTEFHVIQSKQGKSDPRYLFHLFRSPNFRQSGISQMTGSAGQKRVPTSFLKSLQIPLPPLSEQRRLAARLDKADAVRQKSRALVDVYAELGRSVFLEVFGDPVRNERGWEVVELEEISKKITDGTHQSPTFLSEGIPFLFVSNVKNNSISFQTSKYISIEEHEDLYKRTPIEIGDILVTTVGSYGNVAAVASNEKFMFQRHVGYVKPDHSIVKYEFLVSALQSDFVQNQMHRVVKGVAQKTLNLKELKKLQIPLPPLPLQTRFAAMVANIEGQRRLAERQLEAAEAVFGGVLQGTFEG